jgi:hypothetical protein
MSHKSQQVDAVLAHLLPTLASLLTLSVSGDCRFLCLKLLCDILLLMLGEPGLYNPKGEAANVPGSVTFRLNALVMDHILPVGSLTTEYIRVYCSVDCSIIVHSISRRSPGLYNPTPGTVPNVPCMVPRVP